MMNLPNQGAHYSPVFHLAKSLNAELRAVSVQEKLPAYDGYIDAEVPGGTALLRDQASEYYRKLQADAKEAARQAGITLTTELVDGNEVDAVVDYVVKTHSDLLIVGIHRHSSLLSGLWNHTAHDLSQRVASDIMGVH